MGSVTVTDTVVPVMTRVMTPVMTRVPRTTPVFFALLNYKKLSYIELKNNQTFYSRNSTSIHSALFIFHE